MRLRYGLILVVMVMAGLILGSMLPSGILLAGALPDFLLILVVYNCMFTGPVIGGAAGFAVGLAEDLFLGRFIGLNALVKAMVGFIVGRTSRAIFKENLWVPILNVFWGSLLNFVLVYIVGRIVGNRWPLELALWRLAFGTLYNVCLVPLTYGAYFDFADHLLKSADI